MPLFRRSRAPQLASPEAIAGFWAWWTTEGARHCAHLIDGGNLPALEPVIGPAVQQMHPDLAWEVGPGRNGGRLLVVTAAGDPRLRATARRWLQAAPAPDGPWEYADTRQPSPDAETGRLHLGATGIAFADLRAGWRVDEDRVRVDVAVHHPEFASLDEGRRLQIAFLALDALLGEEAVELWVGALTAVVDEPAGATTLAPLRTAVRDLAARHAGPEPTWQLLHADDGTGRPLLAMVRLPLTSAAAPHLDAHVRVELPYAGEDSGLPRPDELERLRDLEDRIEAVLGSHGRVVAHQTSAGLRTLHVYADRTTDAADRVVASVAGSPDVRTSVTDDPAWEAVAHHRGLAPTAAGRPARTRGRGRRRRTRAPATAARPGPADRAPRSRARTRGAPVRACGPAHAAAAARGAAARCNRDRRSAAGTRDRAP